MKTLALLISMVLIPALGFSQNTIFGKWITIDDETGKKKSVVEIYQKDGKVYGKILKLFRSPDQDPDPLCTKCPEDDSRFNQKIIGMEILKDMVEDGKNEDMLTAKF